MNAAAIPGTDVTVKALWAVVPLLLLANRQLLMWMMREHWLTR